MEIILIRHTTPNIEKGICYGQSDIDVTTDFFDELQPILKEIGTINYDAVYTSPLIRCQKLAKKINSNVILDDRLKELNFGDWELQPWGEIPKEELNPWMENFVYGKTKNGESYIELHKRTTAFFEEVIQLSYNRIIVVTHAGIMRSLWAYWNNIPLEKSFDLKIDYGAILKIDTELNDQ